MIKTITFCLAGILFISCASKKDVIYLQDIDNSQLDNISKVKPQPKVQVTDILKIDIKALDPESVMPFTKSLMAGNSGNQQVGLLKLQGYLVDEDGNVELPEIGKVEIAGLSLSQAEQKIKAKLSPYLKDPYVSIRILNFKFTIQGEVNQPGTYEITEPNFTLLQALGMAGDLTIRGRRDNIVIVRTLDNERITKRIDLTKSEWMNSDFYFIRQNDWIYVEPNNPQVKTAGFIGNVGILTSVASILLSAVVIITR
ncbi:polysaccharide biosynthesis/export family protein [Flavobacteriaceae bacterium 14752]|uniref:polysaccharide biosynthesis/export family protein n=1 Tax=Mesohalobacter salilacus TaxID=2491711 RepID=UPI000F633B7A|nr:polysaccharide export protein [Flavobacteriaceae bacterium 14752]